ncbi:MAG: Nramp family divalent metal transporter [Thermomicrobiales bacterium]|nr:Nramp family divalent metal transporter [Thermomicrobiales bacterium]
MLSAAVPKRNYKITRILPYLGPAFIAAIAYVDPGNFATNIQGGARYGYLLVWVILASNLMAMLIQALSAKIGIATGHNLAEVMRDHLPDWGRYVIWAITEIVAMATDLAEFIGAALGIHLLFGLDMMTATVITAVATVAILQLHQRGMRMFEALVTVMIGVISVCYLILLGYESHDWGQIGLAATRPRFDGAESVILAAGMLGATVMPHAIFLHSALVNDRTNESTTEQRKLRLFKIELVDIFIAMSIAGLVNASMLIMAASTFYDRGLRDVASIEVAYATLEPLLGRAASAFFGISLLVSGLASASVGTLAGQTMMQGFLHKRIPIWLRRVVTMAPSFVVVWLGWDVTNSLVVSQVVLSFGIPFALIPLVIYTSRKDIMGSVMVNTLPTKIIASAVSVLIVALNIYLLYSVISG